MIAMMVETFEMLLDYERGLRQLEWRFVQLVCFSDSSSYNGHHSWLM